MRIAFWVSELQARGTRHWHVRIDDTTPRELKRLASRYDFGLVDDPYRQRRMSNRSLGMMFLDPVRAGPYATKGSAQSMRMMMGSIGTGRRTFHVHRGTSRP